MNATEWTRITELLHRAIAHGDVDAVVSAEPQVVQMEVRRLFQSHCALESGSNSNQKAGRILAGRYRLESLLGSGGTAEAWLATDLETFDSVVAKVPHSWEWFREDLRRRFLAEADALRRVSHPGVMTVLDVRDTDDGAPFLVMPFVAGDSLRVLIESGRVDPASACEVCSSLASAIDAAHSAGLVHRDIKPENVLVRRADGPLQTCLIDFGICLFTEFAERHSTTTRFFGTTQYMAPEQLLGTPSAASDVYAFALVMYELFTGRALFPALPPAALYERQRRLTLGDLDGVALQVRRVLYAALRPDPRDRPRSAGEFARRLTSAINGHAWSSVPSRRAILGTAAAVVPALAWVGYRYAPVPDSERRITYLGGQTFREVGWQSFGKIDSDLVELNAARDRYTGNRVVAPRQGGYWRPLSAATARAAFRRPWKLTARLRPIHGYTAFGLGLPSHGVRFVFEMVAPDRGGAIAQVVRTVHPQPEFTSTPIIVPPPGNFVTAEMRFHPETKSVSASIDGREFASGYPGSRQYVVLEGLFTAVGPFRSESGEGVIGDIHFELLA